MGATMLEYVDNPLFTVTDKKVAVAVMFIPASKGNLQSLEHSTDHDAIAFLALCDVNPSATDGFPHKRRVIQNFEVIFDVVLNNMLNKQSLSIWDTTTLMCDVTKMRFDLVKSIAWKENTGLWPPYFYRLNI